MKHLSKTIQSGSRAVLEHFHSTFRAVSGQLKGISIKISGNSSETFFKTQSEQIQSRFRAGSEQFKSTFRALSGWLRDILTRISENPSETSFKTHPEWFQSGFRAISEQLRGIPTQELGESQWHIFQNSFRAVPE